MQKRTALVNNFIENLLNVNINGNLQQSGEMDINNNKNKSNFEASSHSFHEVGIICIPKIQIEP